MPAVNFHQTVEMQTAIISLETGPAQLRNPQKCADIEAPRREIMRLQSPIRNERSTASKTPPMLRVQVDAPGRGRT
jgi:hypothetical protein